MSDNLLKQMLNSIGIIKSPSTFTDPRILVAENSFPENIRNIIVNFRGDTNYLETLVKLHEYLNVVDHLKSTHSLLQCFKSSTAGNYNLILSAIDDLIIKCQKDMEEDIHTVEVWNDMIKFLMDNFRIFRTSDVKFDVFKIFCQDFECYAHNNVHYKDEMTAISDALNKLTDSEINLMISLYGSLGSSCQYSKLFGLNCDK